MDNTILQRATQLGPRLIDIRRTIHRHPELGFSEYRTSAYVAEILVSLGVEVETGVGITGVVGEMGAQGPVVALRADMDALPLQEQNNTEYASQVPGVMHACGHDVHTACLLGAAMLLKEYQPQGRVRFLFQPSEEGMDEEGKSGAMRMVEEGALENVEAVFGMHVDSKHEAGTIACSPGFVLAALDNFKIDILGRGAHGAQAYMGVDAILLAAQVIQAMHAIVSRRIPAMDSGVISIGTIHGGTKENNLAERVELRGTIRSFDPGIRQTLIQEIERACSLARTMGGDYEFSLQTGYPSLWNDPALAAFTWDLAVGLIGQQAVKVYDPEMGSEDFAFYTQKIPGCYFMLGGGKPGQPVRPHHHPGFDIDESILPLGAAMLALLAKRYLDEKPTGAVP